MTKIDNKSVATSHQKFIDWIEADSEKIFLTEICNNSLDKMKIVKSIEINGDSITFTMDGRNIHFGLGTEIKFDNTDLGILQFSDGRKNYVLVKT